MESRHSRHHASKRHRHHRHRHEQHSSRRRPGAFSITQAPQTGAGLCIISAVIGALIYGSLAIVSHEETVPVSPAAQWGASVPAILSCLLGFYACAYRPRGKNIIKLVLGLAISVTLLTLHLLEYRKLNIDTPATVSSQTMAAATKTMNNATVSGADDAIADVVLDGLPGWRGAHEQDGLRIALKSCHPKSGASESFNRRAARPVSFAVLSVVNDRPVPVTLQSLSIELHMDDDSSSTSIAPRLLLLRDPVANGDLIRRIAEPITVSAGKAAYQLPICNLPTFDWSMVKYATVKVDGTEIKIYGRMYLAKDKCETDPDGGSTAPGDGTEDKKAEDWYDGL